MHWPGVSERGQMRRRLREQRRVREGLLLDLGALVYELHRQGKRAPELLQQKAAELTVVDEEVRELQAALDGGDAPAQETTEVEAIEELGGESPLEDEEDALDEEREEDVGLDDDEPLGEEAGDEDEPRAEDDTGEAGEIASEDETLAEHEEPRA
jgi:hypothetical protein